MEELLLRQDIKWIERYVKKIAKILGGRRISGEKELKAEKMYALLVKLIAEKERKSERRKLAKFAIEKLQEAKKKLKSQKAKKITDKFIERIRKRFLS